MKKSKSLVSLLLVLLLGVASGCATDKAVISQATDVHHSLEPAVIEDPVLANYLQEVGDRIKNSAQELDRGKSHKKGEDNAWMFGDKMKFHFVNSKTLNAFTTGGEHMYIYNQLFQESKTEDELAAVMAHEYAHVYARHVHKGMNRQYGTLAAMAAAGGAGYLAGGSEHGGQYAGLAAGAAGGIAQFANMGFTRKDEAEADKLGFDFYTHAGWDPNRFGDFFQHMIDKGLDKTPAYMSDHPTLKSRVEAAKKHTEELPPQAKQWAQPPVASEKRFKELQARAAKLGKTLPDDKSLAQSQKLLQALPRSCVAPDPSPPDAVQARQSLVDDAQKAQQQTTAAQPVTKKKKKPAAQ